MIMWRLQNTAQNDRILSMNLPLGGPLPWWHHHSWVCPRGRACSCPFYWNWLTWRTISSSAVINERYLKSNCLFVCLRSNIHECHLRIPKIIITIPIIIMLNCVDMYLVFLFGLFAVGRGGSGGTGWCAFARCRNLGRTFRWAFWRFWQFCLGLFRFRLFLLFLCGLWK